MNQYRMVLIAAYGDLVSVTYHRLMINGLVVTRFSIVVVQTLFRMTARRDHSFMMLSKSISLVESNASLAAVLNSLVNFAMSAFA